VLGGGNGSGFSLLQPVVRRSHQRSPVRGLTGVQQSVDLYRRLLTGMSIRVEEQVVAGDRVTSRFVVTGTSYGRRVQFNGITISRFEDGLIVEDWSVTDTLGMLRQLGVLRALFVWMKSLGHPRP